MANQDLLFSASRDTLIQVRRITKDKIGEKIAVLSTHTDIVRSLIYVEKMNLVLSAGEDVNIKIWDVTTLKLKDEIITPTGGIGLSMVLLEKERTCRSWV